MAQLLWILLLPQCLRKAKMIQETTTIRNHPRPSDTVLGIGILRPPPRPFVPSRGDQKTEKTKDTSPADLPRDAFLEVSSPCEMNCFRLKGLEGHLSSKESIPKSGSKQKCLGWVFILLWSAVVRVKWDGCWKLHEYEQFYKQWHSAPVLVKNCFASFICFDLAISFIRARNLGQEDWDNEQH